MKIVKTIALVLVIGLSDYISKYFEMNEGGEQARLIRYGTGLLNILLVYMIYKTWKKKNN